MKLFKGSSDFSQNDEVLSISFKYMARILNKYPISDLIKDKQLKNPNKDYNEIMREVILDCYHDLKKHEA